METTWKLKPNIKWHDGTPLLSEDFVFAWRVYRTPDLGFANTAPLNQMEEVAAPDGAHLDSMNALDRPAEDRRIDALNSAAVRAEALRAHDQRQCDRVDAEDQWPFLGDDMKQ